VTATALHARRAPRPIRALLLRYLLLLRRDPSRVVDTFYWPLMDVLIWGFITIFVAQRGITLPNAMAVFLGAIILWDLFFRCEQRFAWDRLLYATSLNVVYLALAGALVARVFRIALHRGLLPKVH
jgi:ABC-2 type transport system permease protein